MKRAFCFHTSIALVFLLIGFRVSFAQNVSLPSDKIEQLTGQFNKALTEVKILNNVPDNDFSAFIRFNEQKIDSDRGKLYAEILKGHFTALNINSYARGIVKEYAKLYKDFLKIKIEYPSTIEEYAKQPPHILQTFNCDSSCTNPDFSRGDLYGWYAAYGVNNSNFAPANSNYFNITNVNWTQCIAGQVVAAQDPFTNNSYQVRIMHGGNDLVVPSIPCVSPFSTSNYSARIGDSNNINYGAAMLQQTFRVNSASQNFNYQYAVFLENPAHVYYNQPFFSVVVMDSAGDTIPQCGKYLVTSGYQTGGGQGWDSTTVIQSGVPTKLYYKNWTSVYVSLQRYIGHCVTVRFTVSDCAQGGHYGYAYVTTSCAPQQLISSSPTFCGQNTITLTGPPGGATYKWTGPINGIPGSDSTQSIAVDSPGHYTVVITPVTGNACNDTVSITIPRGPGPIPVPSFNADTVCLGQNTQFTNTSNPLSGAGVKFYWDFYDQGSFQDSSKNPTWLYPAAGIFKVKLHEVNNGCGADTVIQVKIDSSAVPAFSVVSACLGSAVNFTNNTVGGFKYSWNFGEPSSGTADTSSLVNPSHTYTSIGSYTVTLVATNKNACPSDTTRQVINVSSPPTHYLHLSKDTVCQSGTITLSASGGTGYEWDDGGGISFANPVQITISSNTTFTLTVYNGGCVVDTVFTLYVNSLPIINISQPGRICPGDSIVLTAQGGGTYKWSTGSTNSSIKVSPTVLTTYKVKVNNGCLDSASTTVTPYVPVLNVCCIGDTVKTDDSIRLFATGARSYTWSPAAGLSCTNCPDPWATPTVTTVYTVTGIDSNGCESERSVTVYYEKSCKDFYVPNVFSPNNDGINDDFVIQTYNLTSYNIIIYDRWGIEMYTSVNPNEYWNGRIKNDKYLVPDGVYYYIITATCQAGNSFVKKGFVEVVGEKQ